MISNLASLQTFVRVVAAGSLSAAARDMDLSTAMISKRLTQLERELGIRLLQRTTRKQALTEEGALFHAQALRILAAVEDAQAVMSGRSQSMEGSIRMSAPGELGRQWLIARPLAPNFRVLCASPAYLRRHGRPAQSLWPAATATRSGTGGFLGQPIGKSVALGRAAEQTMRPLARMFLN